MLLCLRPLVHPLCGRAKRKLERLTRLRLSRTFSNPNNKRMRFPPLRYKRRCSTLMRVQRHRWLRLVSPIYPTATQTRRLVMPQRLRLQDRRMAPSYPHNTHPLLRLGRTMVTSHSSFTQSTRPSCHRRRCLPHSRHQLKIRMWRNIGRRQARITHISLTPPFPLGYYARTPHLSTICPCATHPLTLRLLMHMSALTHHLELFTRASRARRYRVGPATD